MLSKLRKEKGYSQRELAEKITVHWRTIQNWEEKGIGNARVKDIQKAAIFFNCKIEDLI